MVTNKPKQISISDIIWKEIHLKEVNIYKIILYWSNSSLGFDVLRRQIKGGRRSKTGWETKPEAKPHKYIKREIQKKKEVITKF